MVAEPLPLWPCHRSNIKNFAISKSVVNIFNQNFACAGLEISEDRHLPCITKKYWHIWGKILFSIEKSNYSLALLPEELVNTSGRVLFLSPDADRVRPKKMNICVYYLMKISNRVGRLIFFFIYFFIFI